MNLASMRITKNGDERRRQYQCHGLLDNADVVDAIKSAQEAGWNVRSFKNDQSGEGHVRIITYESIQSIINKVQPDPNGPINNRYLTMAYLLNVLDGYIDT